MASDAYSSSDPTVYSYSLALDTSCRRIRNELVELGIDPDDESQEINIHVLNTIDDTRYHCTNESAVHIFVDLINRHFGSDSVHVLDMGSGMAGRARILAYRRPATNVLALEWVPGLSTLAHSLSRRCTEVKDKVRHISATVEELLEPMGWSDEIEQFHAAQCVMSLCRVSNLEVVLRLVHRRLKDNGILYIEDLWASQDLSQEHQELVSTLVGNTRRPLSNVDWCDLLSKVGFATVEFQDMTKSWQPWTEKRWQSYRDSMERHVRVQGEQPAQHILTCYYEADQIFRSGDLKGCRILAKKSEV